MEAAYTSEKLSTLPTAGSVITALNEVPPELFIELR
jgi:hypothetical protein